MLLRKNRNKVDFQRIFMECKKLGSKLDSFTGDEFGYMCHIRES